MKRIITTTILATAVTLLGAVPSYAEGIDSPYTRIPSPSQLHFEPITGSDDPIIEYAGAVPGATAGVATAEPEAEAARDVASGPARASEPRTTSGTRQPPTGPATTSPSESTHTVEQSESERSAATTTPVQNAPTAAATSESVDESQRVLLTGLAALAGMLVVGLVWLLRERRRTA